METKFIVLMVLLTVFIVLPLTWAIFALIRQGKTRRTTQRLLSDPDRLRLINDQPDGMLSPHLLRDQTELSLNEARTRLSDLMMYGILNRSVSNGSRYFYGLREELPTDLHLDLSPDPFLTVEDLLVIFAAYDYRLTAQQVIMATGLPLAVIKREMRYFEDQKIVQRLSRTNSDGATVKRFFVLQDPYRSDPARFRAQAEKLDLAMREILVNDNLIV